jgi:hypothetical protein
MISTISQYALLIIAYHRYRYACFIPWLTSTYLRGTLGSIASLLAATLYQANNW